MSDGGGKHVSDNDELLTHAERFVRDYNPARRLHGRTKSVKMDQDKKNK